MSGQCALAVRFDNRRRWGNDTNLFHRVGNCGQVINLTMQVCSQSEKQQYDASVELPAASDKLIFGIVWFCGVGWADDQRHGGTVCPHATKAATP
jgi:hypothetical protein